jgi:hypothetical protein
MQSNDNAPAQDVSTGQALGEALGNHLHRCGALPTGSFVTNYFVLAVVESVDGSEDAAWMSSTGFGAIGQLGLLRKVQVELESR